VALDPCLHGVVIEHSDGWTEPDEAAHDPRTTFYQARIHRAWGQRPEHNSQPDQPEGRR